MNILIVEDDMQMLDIIKDTLVVFKGVEFKFAENFDEAKAALDSSRFDVVITDYNFPGGNGDEVAQLARENPKTVVVLNSDSVIYTESLYHHVSKSKLMGIRDFLKDFLGGK